MLKKVFFMLLGLMLLVSGSCFAARTGNVPATEGSLGGITLGCDMSYVESIYGNPSERYWTKDHIHEDAIANRYGKGFYILQSSYNMKVDEVYVNANNGIATPAGVTVGVPKTTVDSLYGSGSYWKGSYMYWTTAGKVIEITYGRNSDGITVVKSIRVRYQG